jgi:serine/threonine-protein phosphatase 2B catalytic subunit
MDGRAASNQLENTIRAVQEKKPIPEIDFTLHTMEDGTQVSTQERVCKGAVLFAPKGVTG